MRYLGLGPELLDAGSDAPNDDLHVLELGVDLGVEGGH